MTTCSDEYVQVISEPDSGCDGRGLANLVRTIAEHLEISYCVVSDMDVAGVARPELLTESDAIRVLPVGKLLELIGASEQVVWASVFLCHSKEQAATLRGDEDYTESLRKADGLIRAVDAGAYYIYSKAQSPFLGLSVPDETDRAHRGLLSLEFPE